jgi:hypothetical protein
MLITISLLLISKVSKSIVHIGLHLFNFNSPLALYNVKGLINPLYHLFARVE